MNRSSSASIGTALLAAACIVLAAQPAAAQCIPQNFPQNWLQQQENAGGHTIARHTGKTDQQLVQRLQQQQNIAAASTYTNAQTASAAITAGLASQRNAINNWAGNAQAGARRADNFAVNNVVGRVAFRPANLNNIVNSMRFRTVLQATGGGNCYLLTSYPTRPPGVTSDGSTTMNKSETSETDWTTLNGYLAGNFADTELDDDKLAAVEGLTKQTLPGYQQALDEGRKALNASSYDWHQIPDYANRTLTSQTAAFAWLTQMLDALEAGIKKLG